MHKIKIVILKKNFKTAALHMEFKNLHLDVFL